MDYRTPKIVQSGRYVHCCRLFFVLCLAMVLLLIWMLYRPQGGQAGPSDVSGQAVAMAAQAERIAGLESERTRLMETQAALERSSQIDREAVRQTQEELKNLLADRTRLEQELVVLQGILRGSMKEEGLHILDFSLRAGDGSNRYNYRFTVSQALKSAGIASGWIHLAVEGLLDDEKTRLELNQLTDPASEKIKMRFKHFQDVAGTLLLPLTFTPQSVIIEIKPTNKKLAPVNKRFAWVLADR